MKILYITQLLPYPLDTGGKIKTYKTIKLLAKNHQIHLVCFVPKPSDLKYKKELEKLCKKVMVFVSPLVRARYKDILGKVFLNLFSLTPFIFYRYFNFKMEQYINTILKKEKFDAIHIDHLNIAQYLPKEKNCLWVLEEHNIESQGKFSIAKKERFPFNLVFFWEAVRLWLMEKKWFKEFDYILAISDRDKGTMIRKGVRENYVFVLPTPMKVKNLFSWGNKNILFVGLLSWWPNKDGFYWFYEKVFPLIKNKIPDVKFTVVGDGAREKMKNYAKKDSSLHLVGYVKDIKPFLKNAGVFIIPLRMGSGVRIKALTAMAAGIPVVSTFKGVEGISLSHNKKVLIADRPEVFAEKIIKVIKEKKLAYFLSRNGQEFIKRSYSQNLTEKILLKIYCR